MSMYLYVFNNIKFTLKYLKFPTCFDHTIILTLLRKSLYVFNL